MMRQDDENPSSMVPVAPVAPVVRERVGPALPRVVVVALVVGVAAFMAGILLGSGPRTGVPLPSTPAASPPTSAPASPSTVPSAAASPVTAPPSTSEFVRRFRPQAVIAGLSGGGAACATHTLSVPGFSGAGYVRPLIRVWTAFCPLAANKRAQFVDRLTIALQRQVPFQSGSFSSGDGGRTLVHYAYTQGSFAGTVTLVTDAAGGGLAIAITLEEQPVR